VTNLLDEEIRVRKAWSSSFGYNSSQISELRISSLSQGCIFISSYL